jgi:hypothetical protein
MNSSVTVKNHLNAERRLSTVPDRNPSDRNPTDARALPTLRDAHVVAGPPEPKPGSWAGAPSAVLADGKEYVAYRLRRPIGEGRGYANVVAVSRDGVTYTEIARVVSESFDSESLERPSLVVTPEGRWRLYVSCATPNSKHWRVDLLEADRPEDLATAPARTVLPGSDEYAVKDPVILHAAGRWHLWASVHPLERWNDADRMTTDYATSPDGVDWTWHGTVLAGRPGEWDARGARVSSVLLLPGGRVVAAYDGRASAAQNWEEVTGIAEGAVQPDGLIGTLVPNAAPPLRSPDGPGGLRYVSVLPLDAQRTRVYYEVTRPDGAHELHAELLENVGTAAEAGAADMPDAWAS